MATRPTRIRPYKDFLTPAMHRRFALATAILFILCYVEAVLIGEYNSYFWTWFPLGRAGIRTGLLFISAFPIFLLRLSRLHVGTRMSNSAITNFLRHGLQFTNLVVLAFYLFSAWFFSEIYIWSASQDADLNRIKIVQKGRPMLNERPIYLTCYFYILAAVQTGFHLYYDYDKLNMPVTKTKPKASSDQRPHLVIPAEAQLKSKLVPLLLGVLLRSIAMSCLSPFIYLFMNFPILPGVYSFNIRRFAWNFTRGFAQWFWNLPKSGALPARHPFHIGLPIRALSAGFLLTLLWEVGNAALSAYVAQEPLKNERPITYESRDPNGSLLTGLTGKKMLTRAFAFWELVYIAQRFEKRRRAIFEDIDREGGATWSQVLALCLNAINGINLRIKEFEGPPAPAVNAASSLAKKEEIEGLPRLLQPLQERPEGAFAKPRPRNSKRDNALEVVDTFAKAHGQSQPQQWSPTGWMGPILAAVGTQVRDPANWLLNTRLAAPFRQAYRRRITAVVLGTPFGDETIIVDGIDALTRLAVCSLDEDKYGEVQRDFKVIFQTFTNTIQGIERLKQNIGFHWTDVEKVKESPEVDTILAALKGGLQELLEAFAGYSEVLRLSQSDIRLAREAATTAREKEPEMRQDVK